MLLRRPPNAQGQTATKRIVPCSGCVGLSFFALVGFGHLQKMQAADNTQPNHQVSAAPTKSELKGGLSYGKLPFSFEGSQGQTSAPVKFLARGALVLARALDGRKILRRKSR